MFEICISFVIFLWCTRWERRCVCNWKTSSTKLHPLCCHLPFFPIGRLVLPILDASLYAGIVSPCCFCASLSHSIDILVGGEALWKSCDSEVGNSHFSQGQRSWFVFYPALHRYSSFSGSEDSHLRHPPTDGEGMQSLEYNGESECGLKDNEMQLKIPVLSFLFNLGHLVLVLNWRIFLKSLV